MKKETKKFIVLSALALTMGCMGGGSSPSDIRPAGSEDSGTQVFRGVITANQIDISADDGSLLPERLNVGDEVFIIFSPQGGARQGWVRVSRTPDDTAGIGWVERKSVRSYGRYKVSDGSAPASIDSAVPMPMDAPLDGLPPLGGDIPSLAPAAPLDAIPALPPTDGGLPPLDQVPLEPVPDNAIPPAADDPLLLLPQSFQD